MNEKVSLAEMFQKDVSLDNVPLGAVLRENCE